MSESLATHIVTLSKCGVHFVFSRHEKEKTAMATCARLRKRGEKDSHVFRIDGKIPDSYARFHISELSDLGLTEVVCW